MDQADTSFAALLKELRGRAGLTQEELSAAAQLSVRSVSDLERGVNATARRQTARLLADALGLDGFERARFLASAQGRHPVDTIPPSAPMDGGHVAATIRTLPRDITSFTGREPELRQVVEACKRAAASGDVVSIYAIGGMAGIGKTAFAVHAAHLLAPHFPDGQIYLSLHAHSPGQQPVDPGDALASLLLTIGVAPQHIPPDLATRSSLWRDRVAGRRLLLILDDATGHEQVRPLVPASTGSLVLVTSRRHLVALEDAQAISLDTLSAADSADLLIRLSGRDLSPADPAVRAVIRLCGYLPLAIGMLARQLHHHPAWSPSALASELASARDSLELMRAENLSVAAAFDLSYQDLSQSQQRLFRSLGLHPGTDIDAYAAAALGDVDLASARSDLNALYDQYLLTEPARGRYRLHDLIREHARALISAEPEVARDAAVSHLLDYYLHTARMADLHIGQHVLTPASAVLSSQPRYVPDLASWDDAVAWMDVERANLHAAADRAAGHGWAGYAVALAAAMEGFLNRRGLWDEAGMRHQVALEEAHRIGDQMAEAGALTDLGEIQQLTGDYPAASANLGRALELWQMLEDRAGEASARYRLGIVQRLTGNYPAATSNQKRALALYLELSDRLGQANALSRLGIVQRLVGDHAKATVTLQEALTLCRELGYRLGEANALSDLGIVQRLTGDYAAAAASQERSLEVSRALGYRVGEAHALTHLSAVQFATGDYQAADETLAQALELQRSLGDRHGEAHALNYLGEIQHASGRKSEAADSIAQALELHRSIGDRLGEAEALNSLGELSMDNADFPRARTYHEQAVAICAEIASPFEEARALAGLGRCLTSEGQRSSGASQLRRAAAIYQEIGSPIADDIQRLLRDHEEPSGPSDNR